MMDSVKRFLSRRDWWVVFPTLGILTASVFSMLANSEVTVSLRARTIAPGEVLLFTVESVLDVESVVATAFSKEFRFSRAEKAGTWEGLVGIDLDTRPGEYRVRLVGANSAGEVFRRLHPIEVLSKEFPTRHLTVEPKYVSPPEEEMERIRRESRQVSRIFSEVTLERHWEGFFLRPVPGKANSNFGKRSVFNGKPRSPHTGTDFTAAKGTPVKAPNGGKVVLAQNLYFAGNTVILDHGLGLYSYFAHLSEFRVAVGDMVSRGDVLGLVGATGRVTGPHLHWTLRLAETRVDPLSMMDAVDTSPR
jgi:murein DD-endopeptidase MepM/ murein hydrolase activator NlpD